VRAPGAITVPRPPRSPWAAANLDRRRLALLGLLLAAAAVSWAVTDDRMGGMDAGPGTDPGDLGFFVSAWVVMMAAMMFPSIAPMVTVYSRLQRSRREKGQYAPAGTTALFVGGYLVTWSAAGLFGYAVVKLARSASIEALSWNEAGPYVAGSVIAAAAVYQLTPLKDVCLRHCRGPLMFLLGHWRDGRGGGLRMGIVHGAWCVGCCWALMAALFALGVMSIGWMALIAFLIAAEKMLPWRRLANLAVAFCLLALGLSVAFVPDRVPGLTQPDSAQARQAMMRMDGGTQMDRQNMNKKSTGGASMKKNSMRDDDGMGSDGSR
jgi:predicted metal-binding membrane protein